MHFGLMSLVFALVFPGIFARAEAPEPVWNTEWTDLQNRWSVEFEALLRLVQTRQLDQAHQRLNSLVPVLANLNKVAQRTIDDREQETFAALRRAIIEEAEQVASKVAFHERHHHDLLHVLLTELVDRTGKYDRLVQPIRSEERSELRRRVVLNTAITGGFGLAGSGGMAAFFVSYQHYLHGVADQTPTTLTVGVIAAAAASYFMWQPLPKSMKRDPNLVLPALEKCRDLLSQ